MLFAMPPFTSIPNSPGNWGTPVLNSGLDLKNKLSLTNKWLQWARPRMHPQSGQKTALCLL